MKTIFEQQGVEYRQVGDYMLPDVELTEQMYRLPHQPLQ